MKTLRNILWAGAAVLAIAALICNPAHLATAGILFLLGSFQNEEEDEYGM